MKRAVVKLELKREAIRALGDCALAMVAGGVPRTKAPSCIVTVDEARRCLG